MSTAPPTTLTPTTIVTTGAPTTAWPPDVVCDPIEIVLSVKHLLSRHPAADRDYLSDITISSGPIELELDIEGGSLGRYITDCVIPITISLLGSETEGQVIADGLIDLTVTLHLNAATTERKKSNWLKWTRVGYADFTKDQTNEAGERPLDWAGLVFKILKLGSSVIVYGENGVTVMTPSGVHWGMQTISTIGVKFKGAVAGTDFEHFFVDKKDRLCRLTTKGIEILDYSDYLSVMTNPVLSLNPELGLLYICDGSNGFIYSINSNSFGAGPSNVSGIWSQDGTLYVAAPGAISTPTFEICTDIYDFGVRCPKTINYLDVGTDLVNKLQAMIEARVKNNASFNQSRWVIVNPSGKAVLPAYGVEFKIHLRATHQEYFEIDYIRIVGQIHEYNYLNRVD